MSLQLAVAASAAEPGNGKEPGEGRSAQERARSTSIVWLESSQADLGKRAAALTAFLNKGEVTATVIFNFEGSVGLLVEGNPTATRVRFQQIAKTISDDEKQNIFGGAAGFDNVAVDSNPILYSFAECADPQWRYDSQERRDWGVDWVWQNKAPDDYSTGRVAWVIDSGIGTGFHGELRVPSRLDCTQSGCPDDGQATDRIGHGTMIAGIIGARQGNKKGIVGVAPGANINSLRVVDESTGQLNLSSVVRALGWLLYNATGSDDGNAKTPSPGDVINLSLGAAWSPASKTQRDVEDFLRKLADMGFKISIAAGNSDTLGGLAYAQAISPARAGGYGPTAKGGLIVTVSAFDKNGEFWPASAFGNYYDYFDQNQHKERMSLPNYSEPGMDVLSLWPGPGLAICSGTSLSAAHMSGILLWGDVYESGKVKYDPSAGKLDLGRAPQPGNPNDYEDALLDPIGLKKP